MKKINLGLDKSKKYLIACSYGPDSMALLYAAYLDGLNFVVAHVNYHKRDVSNFEEQSLKEYCFKISKQIEVLDTKNLIAEGNFQEWARELRYRFFRDVATKHDCDAVLVAHQEDDVIETYLMQKKRGNLVKNPGIAKENELFGVKVIRPLLSYSKQFLKEYDEENGVPYSIDESNLTDHYTRNKFRHHIVEKMNSEERQNILNQINNEKELIDVKNEYDYKEFATFNYEKIVRILDFYMEKCNEHRDLSRDFINEIKKAFSNKTNLSVEITKSILLEKNYSTISIINATKLKDYEFNFNGVFSNEFLDIDFANGTADRKFEIKSGKYAVRNAKKNEKIIVKNYECKVNRLFIDWKMPNYLRRIWPGIYDENGKLIYIPRYRKNFSEKHTSKFKIDTKFFEKF